MSKGVYVAVKYKDSAKEQIDNFIKTNNIKNPVRTDSLHSTIIYSTKYDNIVELGDMMQVPVEIFKFEVWKTQDGKSALVGKLFAPDLIKRHLELMSNHDLTYDYPEYKPHITISYDVGDDFDINLLQASDIGKLYTAYEYKEDLELDWASKNA